MLILRNGHQPLLRKSRLADLRLAGRCMVLITTHLSCREYTQKTDLLNYVQTDDKELLSWLYCYYQYLVEVVRIELTSQRLPMYGFTAGLTWTPPERRAGCSTSRALSCIRVTAPSSYLFITRPLALPGFPNIPSGISGRCLRTVFDILILITLFGEQGRSRTYEPEGAVLQTACFSHLHTWTREINSLTHRLWDN